MRLLKLGYQLNRKLSFLLYKSHPFFKYKMEFKSISPPRMHGRVGKFWRLNALLQDMLGKALLTLAISLPSRNWFQNVQKTNTEVWNRGLPAVFRAPPLFTKPLLDPDHFSLLTHPSCGFQQPSLYTSHTTILRSKFICSVCSCEF